MRGIGFGATVAIGLSLAGCQSTVDTASGRPEVVMPAAPADVKAALIGTYVDFGNSLTKDSDFQIVIEEAGLSPTAKAIFGPGMDYRMSFTLLPAGSNTRVIGEGALVKNNGTAFEKTLAVNTGAPAEWMQFTLDTIAAGFAARKPVDVIVTETAAAVKAKFSSYYANAPKTAAPPALQPATASTTAG